MSTVKRVAPKANRLYPEERAGWHVQCLQDLAEGRHAVGCGCITPRAYNDDDDMWTKFNACTEIVRCALEMRDYETEVEDASDKQPECL